jgi:hypothetical protein
MLPAASRLDDALELQRAGKLNQASDALLAAIAELHASGGQSNLLKALSAESWILVSLGKYEPSAAVTLDEFLVGKNRHRNNCSLCPQPYDGLFPDAEQKM